MSISQDTLNPAVGDPRHARKHLARESVGISSDGVGMRSAEVRSPISEMRATETLQHNPNLRVEVILDLANI